MPSNFPSAGTAQAQEWPLSMFDTKTPAPTIVRSEPRYRPPTLSPSAWRTSIERIDNERVAPAVAAADPLWTASVKFSKAPLLVSNPIPRSPPRLVNPLTGQSHKLEGVASYYWQDQMTSTGERFDKMGMTAAHRTLPFNTRVRVTNIVNGRSVVVRINDRGPYKPGRILDLSLAAGRTLDMERDGLAPVKIEVISN